MSNEKRDNLNNNQIKFLRFYYDASDIESAVSKQIDVKNVRLVNAWWNYNTDRSVNMEVVVEYSGETDLIEGNRRVKIIIEGDEAFGTT